MTRPTTSRAARVAACLVAVAASTSAGCGQIIGLGNLHPRVAQPYHLIGRWDTSASSKSAGIASAVAEWPGSGVFATFTGTGVGVDLLESPNAAYGNYDSIVVEIDGVPSMPMKLDPAHCPKGECHLGLASGLAATKTHTVAFYKTTDSTYGGRITFQSFVPVAPGRMVDSFSPFAHQIEFIGDDIAVGRAVRETQTTPCATIDEGESDEYLSFAAILARHYGAERHNLSACLSGVYESNGDVPLLPAIYPEVLPSEAGNLWSMDPASSAWQPELVVVNLGGYGDFGSTKSSFEAPSSAEETFEKGFEKAYESFLRTVRAAHPSAFILVVAGDGYGGHIDHTVASSFVEAVVSDLTTSGEESSSTLAFYSAPVQPSYACAYYPNVPDQDAMAAEIEAQIRKSPLAWP